MASKVTRSNDGTFGFECDVPRCRFTSVRHLTRKAALARLDEHQAEHDHAAAHHATL